MDTTTFVELILLCIFIGPLSMICPMLLIPTANFHVLSLNQVEQDFLLARSRQDWLISRNAQRFSASPINQSPTPIYSSFPCAELQDAPRFETDPDLLYRSSKEVLVADVWFDFCRGVQSFLAFDEWLAVQSRQLPFHRQISKAFQDLYLEVLVFINVQSCRLSYLFYSTPSSPSSLEPKQKAHTRMREPRQIKSRSIVAYSQSMLFWLFDLLVVHPGKHFPDSTFIRAIGNFLVWLWVILINGDQEIHDSYRRHDLTHLYLGLGTSEEDEILTDISETFLFCEEGFSSLGSFQSRFIDELQKNNPHLGFTETFTVIREAQPRIAKTHQRLSYILNRPAS